MIDLSEFYKIRYNDSNKFHHISSTTNEYFWFVTEIRNNIHSNNNKNYRESELSRIYIEEINNLYRQKFDLIEAISNMFYLISLIFFYRINTKIRLKLEQEFRIIQSEQINKESLNKALERILDIIQSDNLLNHYCNLIKFNRTHFHTLKFYNIKHYEKSKNRKDYINRLSILANIHGSNFLKELEKKKLLLDSKNKNSIITKTILRNFIQDFRFKKKQAKNHKEKQLRNEDLSKLFFKIHRSKNDTKYSITTRFYGVLQVLNDLKHCIEDLRLANLIMKIFHENEFNCNKNDTNIRLLAIEIKEIINKQNLTDLKHLSKNDIQAILKESFELSFNQT